jgi:hypothetical protein
VVSDRAALMREAHPYLDRARAVAAVDIGWVSATTEAHVVDLAGLTDPEFASLPGGHTSKRVDPAMLLERGVDVAVFHVAADARDPLEPFGRRVHASRGRAPRFIAAVSRAVRADGVPTTGQ